MQPAPLDPAHDTIISAATPRHSDSPAPASAPAPASGSTRNAAQTGQTGAGSVAGSASRSEGVPIQRGYRLVGLSRRGLLAGASAGAAAVVTAQAVGAQPAPLGVPPGQIGPLAPRERRRKAWNLRIAAAEFQANKPLPLQTPNGDEEVYPDFRGSYAKGLPHSPVSGEVDPAAYQIYRAALASGQPSQMEQIPLGGTRKQVSPQAGLAFDMAGADSHALELATPPAFASAQAAAEMVELYWMAVLRDVPFEDYATNPLAIQAAAELGSLGAAYTGPKQGGVVTPGLLFRSAIGLDDVGPYVSQFLLETVNTGPLSMPQRYKTANQGVAYGTNFATWYDIVRGLQPSSAGHLDPITRYMRNGRDLAEMVHSDYSYQAFLQAGLILLGYGGAALSPTNPYLSSASQTGFVTFGPAYILDMVSRAANLALRAAWFQKWYVHRRLRPEEMGGRIHQQVTGAKDYGIDGLVTNSQALQLILSQYNSGLLPLAFPEGSPLHPAYPAGHAAIAGACVTVLKALFNESFVLPTPVIASPDGQSLLPYLGLPLTVRGELDKLAVNISFGRNIAAVHYRTDGTEGMRLGEAAALSLLEDYSATYNENFGGFQLTKFDGTVVQI
jgi:membrane-associated phospholipid phosphatase